MLSVALANLSVVEKKQEEHDKKLDELEGQLARLENRLESRFKLPDVDPSTLDPKYMTNDEMKREAFRLWPLIGERDIPDKESILKRLDGARNELEKWEKADMERGYIDPLSKKYSRHMRLREQEEELCRHRLVSVIFRARWKISDWEWDRQQEEREREKDSPEELTTANILRQRIKNVDQKLTELQVGNWPLENTHSTIRKLNDVRKKLVNEFCKVIESERKTESP